MSLGAPHRSTLEENIRHSAAPEREKGSEREKSLGQAIQKQAEPQARISTAALPSPCGKTKGQRGEGTCPGWHPLGPLLVQMRTPRHNEGEDLTAVPQQQK